MLRAGGVGHLAGRRWALRPSIGTPGVGTRGAYPVHGDATGASIVTLLYAGRSSRISRTVETKRAVVRYHRTRVACEVA
jgi:hypothetical protein